MQLVVLVLLIVAHQPAPAAGREEERVMVPVQEGGAELQPWSETLKRNLNHIEDRPTRDRLRLPGQANTRQEVQG